MEHFFLSSQSGKIVTFIVGIALHKSFFLLLNNFMTNYFVSCFQQDRTYNCEAQIIVWNESSKDHFFEFIFQSKFLTVYKVRVKVDKIWFFIYIRLFHLDQMQWTWKKHMYVRRSTYRCSPCCIVYSDNSVYTPWLIAFALQLVWLAGYSGTKVLELC